jgi:hypothetical protein
MVPVDSRREVLRALVARPTYADLAALIAVADTDNAVRLRLVRVIRDLAVQQPRGGARCTSRAE